MVFIEPCLDLQPFKASSGLRCCVHFTHSNACPVNFSLNQSSYSYESHGNVELFDLESVKEMRHKSSKMVTAIPDAKESFVASHTDQTLRGFSSIIKNTGKLTQKYMA